MHPNAVIEKINHTLKTVQAHNDNSKLINYLMGNRNEFKGAMIRPICVQESIVIHNVYPLIKYL